MPQFRFETQARIYLVIPAFERLLMGYWVEHAFGRASRHASPSCHADRSEA